MSKTNIVFGISRNAVRRCWVMSKFKAVLGRGKGKLEVRRKAVP